MRLLLIILVYMPLEILAQQQEIMPAGIEQQLENMTASLEEETEDDTYWQQAEYFMKHPLSLNTASETELNSMGVLTVLQVQSFIKYRSLLGKLISIYELQAVPAWDINTIRKLLPMITLKDEEQQVRNFIKRFKNGDNNFLLRSSMILEKSKGFQKASPDTGNRYLGSRQKVFARYQYNYKNLLAFGILGDKDAGEEFLKGSQKKGFDFYSFYFFARKAGVFESIAIGDFTVNMGQGLIQWQSMAFRKSADALAVKRQSAVLNSYHSSGEYNFHRGIGVTVKKKNIDLTLFASSRKHSSNINQNAEGAYVSSIISSGYHRTVNELNDKNNLSIRTVGSVLKYRFTGGHIAMNAVGYRFSTSLSPSDEPYDIFSVKGETWSNSSIDYSYTHRNIHMYGELAVDKLYHHAFLQGFMMSLNKRIDVSIICRDIHPAYQSFFSSAFTENAKPSNERGLFMGVTIKPGSILQLDAYADVYRFPWLKFRVDEPSEGEDYMIQLLYKPDKKVELTGCYRNEIKKINIAGANTIFRDVNRMHKRNFRISILYQLNKLIALRTRFDISRYMPVEEPSGVQNGFLCFADIAYKPANSFISGNFRLQYFETDSYDSRIYAYENGALYDFSIPSYYDKGWRYYLNLKMTGRSSRSSNLNIQAWIRWGQVLQLAKTSSGSALDLIEKPIKSEVKIQLIMSW